MSEQEVQFVDLLKYLHAMCFVRSDEIRRLIPELVHKALDAGYWSEAFRVYLHDSGESVYDLQIMLASHIENLGGSVRKSHLDSLLIEITFYLHKLVKPGEVAPLGIADYVMEDLQELAFDEDDHQQLHFDKLNMAYFEWANAYERWLQSREHYGKFIEAQAKFVELTEAWLDQHAVPNPFDRL